MEPLERRAGEFYPRLRSREARRVQEIVGNLELYMIFATTKPFLIAGVGSILRHDDPTRAEDVDIAVPGLTYFNAQRNGGVVPPEIIRARQVFTTIASAYFEVLAYHFEREGYQKPPQRTDQSCDRSVELRRESELLVLTSHIEDFSYYGSKGLELAEKGSRPIHVHFVFNLTPEEWRARQARLEDPPAKRRSGKSPQFIYAVLKQKG